MTCVCAWPLPAQVAGRTWTILLAAVAVGAAFYFAPFELLPTAKLQVRARLRACARPVCGA